LGGSDQDWNGIPLPLELTPIGFVSCMLRGEPATPGLLSDDAVVANWGIAMPNAPSLDGAVFFRQGLVLTPGFDPCGGVTSSSCVRRLACSEGDARAAPIPKRVMPDLAACHGAVRGIRWRRAPRCANATSGSVRILGSRPAAP
jgi:hypothetical protein